MSAATWLHLTATGATVPPALDEALTNAQLRATSTQTPAALLWSPIHGAVVAIAGADFAALVLGDDRADRLAAAHIEALADPNRQRAVVLAPDA